MGLCCLRLSQVPHVENLVQGPGRSSEAHLKSPSANQVSTSLNGKTVSTLFKSSPRMDCKSTFSFGKIFQNLVQLFSAALTCPTFGYTQLFKCNTTDAFLKTDSHPNLRRTPGSLSSFTDTQSV